MKFQDLHISNLSLSEDLMNIIVCSNFVLVLSAAWIIMFEKKQIVFLEKGEWWRCQADFDSANPKEAKSKYKSQILSLNFG